MGRGAGRVSAPINFPRSTPQAAGGSLATLAAELPTRMADHSPVMIYCCSLLESSLAGSEGSAWVVDSDTSEYATLQYFCHKGSAERLLTTLSMSASINY